MRYTIFSSSELHQFFFSTDHIQRYRSPIGGQIDESFVPCSGSLPIYVVPRPSLPNGLVDTLDKYIQIFHDDEIEIPNPDPNYQPDYRPIKKEIE